MKKKNVFLIYGEQTVTVSFKVPESKREKIIAEIRDTVLSKYENPKRIDIDAKENEQRKPKDIVSQKSVVDTAVTANVEELKSEPTASYDLPKTEKAQKKSTAKQYDYVKTLPLGTDLVRGYGSKGALRKLGNEFFTKRTFQGELEIIRHDSESSAFEYAETNFK